jgi:hypothetical protein
MTPFEKRLLDLQLLPQPESAEELAFLEDYVQWKATGGVKAYEAKRTKELKRQSIDHYRLRVKLSKKHEH